MTNTLTISSEHKLRQENLAFDADVWYPIISQFTFKTVFLPLRRCEAIAIVHYFNARYLNKNLKQFTTYDVKILNELEQRISKLITNNNEFCKHGVFMRLCGRSAKDCDVLDRDKNLKQKYDQQLKKLLEKDKKELNPETKLIAIARTQYLKITTAKEAMAQLLSSERVCIDCRDWILYGEPEQIVFRTWNDDVTKDYEFRVFVYNNKITAISQYDYYGVFQYLFQQKDKFKKMIYTKWKIVHPFIKQNNYVIDFAYLKSKDEMIVIEFSPFRRCTGATLFDWDKDKDLLYGKKTTQNDDECKDEIQNDLNEIVFRLNEKQYPNIEHLIEMNWEDRYWKKPKPVPYYKWYDNAYTEKQEIIDAIKESIYDPIWQVVIAVIVAVILAFGSGYSLYKVGEYAAIVGGFGGYYVYKERYSKKPFFIRRKKKKRKKDDIPEIKHDFMEKNKTRYVLFVYGTLKSGFHWNHKFLSRSGKLLSDDAETKYKYPLVIGECGVPYLVDLGVVNKNKVSLGGVDDVNDGKRIKGELWEIDHETLMGLDEYEGVNKKHYKRTEIAVMYDGGKKMMKGFAFFKAKYDKKILKQEFLSEYTLEYHKNNYSPMRHIQVKQLAYLGEDFQRT